MVAEQLNLIYLLTISLLSGLLGAIIGGLISYVATLRQAIYAARISYLTSIINSNLSPFSAFINAVHNRDRDLVQNLQNQPFYNALFAIVPKRLRREFEEAVNSGRWDHATCIITRILTGRW